MTVNTISIESITDSIRHILSSLLPAIHEASPDSDVFSLEPDSLHAFSAVKTIRVGMGLQDQLAPQHLYAYPTLAKFSAALARLEAQTRKPNGMASDDDVKNNFAKMKMMIDRHKARLSFQVSPFDYVTPNYYMGLNFFFALCKEISF